ncbi:hypothetical protein [Gilliamella sp. N-G2]|nr:hypothetical protein [Gilliamella sp. N-G2]OTQ71500.1 hypothetical protein B6C99_12075 [Gilliamella sp. N-G2]
MSTGHATIYPTKPMKPQTLVEFYNSLSWEHIGKNKMCKSNQMQILFDECIKLQDNLLDNIFLLSKCPNLVTLIEKNLIGDINASLLYIIKQLPEEIKISLLPNIIEIMKNLDGKTKLCQDIILSMNREWLKKNIWSYSKYVFDDQDYQSFGIFMYLFNSISDELSQKLAILALESDDEDVREIGQIYFDLSSKI